MSKQNVKKIIIQSLTPLLSYIWLQDHIYFCVQSPHLKI